MKLEAFAMNRPLKFFEVALTRLIKVQIVKCGPKLALPHPCNRNRIWMWEGSACGHMVMSACHFGTKWVHRKQLQWCSDVFYGNQHPIKLTDVSMMYWCILWKPASWSKWRTAVSHEGKRMKCTPPSAQRPTPWDPATLWTSGRRHFTGGVHYT